MAITTREGYIQAVKRHDWFYEAASDQNDWRKGVRERAEISKAQPIFDPGYAIWNSHAPELLRRVAKPQNVPDGEHKTGNEHRA